MADKVADMVADMVADKKRKKIGDVNFSGPNFATKVRKTRKSLTFGVKKHFRRKYKLKLKIFISLAITWLPGYPLFGCMCIISINA